MHRSRPIVNCETTHTGMGSPCTPTNSPVPVEFASEPELEPPVLSSRMSKITAAVLPRIQSQLEDRRAAATLPPSARKIDLGTAENALIRSELTRVYRDAVASRFGAKHFPYPDGFGGDPELVEALASLFNRYFKPMKKVEGEQVVVAAGATSCLEALGHCLCDEGEGMLVAGPYWSGFSFALTIRPGVKLIPVGNEGSVSDVLLSPARLIESMATAVKSAKWPIRALVLTNPHNPFGRCYSVGMLEACAKFCQDNNIHLISDEVYALSVFGATDPSQRPSFVSALELDLPRLGVDPARVHVVWSSSKDFGSSGVRVGAIVSQANDALRTSVALAANIQVSSLAAVATIGLLKSSNLDSLIQLNKHRLRSAYEKIQSFFIARGIHFIPAYAGVFVTARLVDDVRSPEDEQRLVKILSKSGVAISSIQSYVWVNSEPGWVRITFAVEPEQLTMGLKRIDEGLKSWSSMSI